jgi:TonB family protein
MISTCWVRLVSAVVIGSAAGAQVESPASRLEAASALMALDGIDAKPWHLKLDVAVIDETKVPHEGTIEVWHAGADQRIVYAFGEATSTTLQHDGKTFFSPAGPRVPFEAREILQEFLHPGPRQAEMDGSVPELRKQKFGPNEFECVMISQSIKGSGKVPLGLFPTYCMSNGIIRVTYNFGGQTLVLNRIGTFLGHDVAVDARVMEGTVDVATAKVVTLTTYNPQPDEFLPAANMAEAGTTARIAGGVIAGSRIRFVEPIYPASAKSAHQSGTVILHAIIGRDGRIHSLRPTNETYPDFVIAAIAAVRQWVYRPYLLNGEPTEVDTTITVNFALNGG